MCEGNPLGSRLPNAAKWMRKRNGLPQKRGKESSSPLFKEGVDGINWREAHPPASDRFHYKT